MLFKLEDSEIRNICKEKLESLEYWLRRLIDETLSQAYGDFFSFSDSHGNRIIKKQISDSLAVRVSKEPDRYSRKIDAVLLDDAIDIICNPNLFSKHFKDPLFLAFPDGRNVARTFMKRMIEPRNRLAHANTISLRQAEQIVCYTNDIIESIKEYYRNQNMTGEYDVPLILKLVDSFGNSFYRDSANKHPGGGIILGLSDKPEFYMRPGDTFTLDVEVDPSFPEEEYEISWKLVKFPNHPLSNGRKTTIQITKQHVATKFYIQCFVTTNRDWHRLSNGNDDQLLFVIKVLPPI